MFFAGQFFEQAGDISFQALKGRSRVGGSLQLFLKIGDLLVQRLVVRGIAADIAKLFASLQLIARRGQQCLRGGFIAFPKFLRSPDSRLCQDQRNRRDMIDNGQRIQRRLQDAAGIAVLPFVQQAAACFRASG